MKNVQISQLKMGVHGNRYRRPYQKSLQLNGTAITNGQAAFEKCAKCGLKIVGVPHTACARCGSVFCRRCTNGSPNICPKCGFKGS